MPLAINSLARPINPNDTFPRNPIIFQKKLIAEGWMDEDFLSRKTQFKARNILITCLNHDKIYFHPSSAFAAYLYNADWIWEKPDSPTGISVFFCPESSSIFSSYN
jgi:hypothetical protein